MADKIKEAISHNYDPVNQYIDDQARLKRSTSIWRYAKSISLVLIAIGILVLLLAWAYNIFKKPNPELVKKIDLIDKKFNQSQMLDKKQEKLVKGEVIKYNSETLRFLRHEIKGVAMVTTRLRYATTKDLLEGNQPEKITCYLTTGDISYEYENPFNDSLKLMGISYEQAIAYRQYCKYNIN